MRRIILLATSTLLVAGLILALAPQALALDITVDEQERFYYNGYEMSGRLSATRNLNQSPVHEVNGRVDGTAIDISLYAEDHAVNEYASISQTDTPAQGSYMARCSENVAVNRYGFVNVHFRVLAGI